MKAFLLRNRFVIGVLIVVLLCLWQLSFFKYISKWDNIDAYLPSRYFISDYLWKGKFPYWNPFQNLGTPIYSDLQSGLWYPVTWIIMLFGKYTIGSLSVEILSCYLIAAFGFYKLSLFIYKDKRVGFLLGLSYALSGFMVGSSQILPFLIGIAWLPWIIYAYLSFLTTLKYKYSLLTGLFFAVCTTGASPPFSIILVYVFIMVFSYFFIKNRSVNQNLKRLFVGGVIIVVTIILLLLPYLTSFEEFYPYFNRIEKLPFEKLTYNNFTFLEYISFLFPFSVLSDSDLFNHTDVTLRNSYFGIIGFVYLIISLFTVRNKYYFPLIGLAILSLLLAAGAGTPFYKLVYALPGLGVFKHTSFFKVYFIFSCLLLAGFSIKKGLDAELSKTITKNVSKVLLGVIVLITIVSAINMSSEEVGTILTKIINSEEGFEGTFWSHLLINGVVLIVLFLIWIFTLKKTSLFVGLLIVLIADLFIQTQLSAPKTIYNKIEYSVATKFFSELPTEINQEALKTPIKEAKESIIFKKTTGFWRNLPVFNKTISHKGYNPMRFKNYDLGEKNGVLDQTITSPLLYFQDLKSSKIEFEKIGYNTFSAKIENNSEKDKWFLLSQNYHQNWTAVFNKKPLQIQKINTMIMGVKIPKNKSGLIQFSFDSLNTRIAFIISLVSYLLLVIYFITEDFTSKRKLTN